MAARAQLNNQKGIVLLAFVVVILLAASSYFISGVSVNQVKTEQKKQTRIVLKKAKEALIAYAVTYGDRDGIDAEQDADDPGVFGFLPCPDVDAGGVAEGGSHNPCGNANTNSMGLFPWASLETGVLNSASGNCLWYVVSGEYKRANSTAMLNEDTNGGLLFRDSNGTAVPGVNAEDRVVAVIIDPSLPLAAQNRSFDAASTCGLGYTADKYLEGDGVYDNAVLSGGAFAVDDFINAGIGTDELVTPFNDQVVAITRKELWDAVKKNVGSKITRQTEALTRCIAAYGNNSGNRKLPRPSQIDFLGGDYRVDTNYVDTAAVSYLGRYPYDVNNSDAALSAVNAPNGAESVLFDKDYCNALAVAGGSVINLDTGDAEEGYSLWKHWKDHFFYAVSNYYAPSNAVDIGAPSCNGNSSNCIRVNGIEYAAVVIYSGSRIDALAQVRNEPIAGDIDTKNNINNYIEVTSPVGDGTGNYTPTNNDIAFCITDTNPFEVVACP